MRRVIGIGETILDILFKNNQPTVAVPGGSVFNGLVSLGRAGANVTFISEVGGDRVGNIILDFMKDNGISTDNVMVYPDRKSPVSLAFLNEKNDAEYKGGTVDLSVIKYDNLKDKGEHAIYVPKVTILHPERRQGVY